jgi:hypothetical protein
VLRFDLQAIAFDIDDPDAIARSRGPAARGPLAVADPHSSAMGVDRLDHHDNLAEEPPCAVIEERVGAVIVARCVEAPSKDPYGKECQDRKGPELESRLQAEGHRENSGGDRGCPDEDQRETGRNDFGDQKYDAPD